LKKVFLIFFTIFLTYSTYGQVLNNNNLLLNFTQIVFDYKIYENFNKYKLVIAYNCADSSFNKENIIIDTIHESSAIFIKEGIEFNQKYKWKYCILNNKNKVTYTSPVYYFQTGNSSLIDSNFFRLVFRKNEIPDTENFIVVSDAMKIAFNKNGKPIWFLNNNALNNVRDLVLTPKGTFTFLNLNQAFETDKQGNVIWFPPNDGAVSQDTTEKYHHDFTLLKNGNYIICGQKQWVDPDLQPTIGSSLFANKSTSKVSSSTIIEYNKNKQVVWSFDLIPELKRNFNIDAGKEPLMLRVGHLNGIEVDEKNDYVYASFKTFNNIFKIKKSNNSIEYIFGNKQINLKDSLKSNTKFFAAQHAPILLKNGNLMVFNNNEQQQVSSIVELTVPNSFNEESQKVWEYKFDEDGFKNSHSEHLGSVQELANNQFFVCAGAVNRLFLVNKNKQISWDVLTETNVDFNKSIIPNWQPTSSYRAFKYSSLYPYYFTIQYNFDVKKIKATDVIKLYNVGTENDEYEMNYYSIINKKEIVIYSKTYLINAESNQKLPLNNSIILKNKLTQIKIKSKNSGQEIAINFNK